MQSSLVEAVRHDVVENMELEKTTESRQEKSHSPIILPNGEYQENPTLTVRFAILENV